MRANSAGATSVKHLSTPVLHPQKGGYKDGKPTRGKGRKIMAVADRNGLPVSVCAESATPHEVTPAVPTLLQMVVPDVARTCCGRFSGLAFRLSAAQTTSVASPPGRMVRPVCSFRELPKSEYTFGLTGR
jgi:hypothetical protein